MSPPSPTRKEAPAYPPARSASPSPSHRSARKPVPAYVPPVPTPPIGLNERVRPKLGRLGSASSVPQVDSRPEYGRSVSDNSVRKVDRSESAEDNAPGSPVGTLNFHRRPSNAQYDPLTSRPIISPMVSYPAPSPSPSTNSGHGRRQSHNRQASISLTPVLGTKAPIDSFASVEMLQGQRDAEGKRRGNEVFGYGGRYEGRSNQQEAFIPRPGRIDPAASARQARGGPPQLPAMDIDTQSIAVQLQDHDRRRGSRDSGNESDGWRRRLSGSSATSDVSPPSTGGGEFITTKNFSFPPRNSDGSLISTKSAPAYSLDDDEEFMDHDDGDLSSPYNHLGEKSLYAMEYSSQEKLNKSPGGWNSEYGSTPKSLHQTFAHAPTAGGDASRRPSIVALPVYPSPSGTNARSLKYKAKSLGRGLSWLTVLAMNAAMGIYLVKRIQALIVVERNVEVGFISAWCFIAVEILVAVMVGISSLWTVFTYRNKSASRKLRLRGDKNLPTVDVFIVTSGQEDSYVFDCAIAAASMDYPPHKFRVMVLDSVGSAILERDIGKHAKQQGCPHLTYHRRILDHTAGIHFQTKANTLNFGMKEAASFGVKGAGEFIAVFEADVIPERNFLRAALPAILATSKMGLVKTGHGYINLPHRLNQATATLMEGAEHESDSHSGFVLRRTALVDIGGFPADSWLHDGHCEALLAGRGFKTVVVDEVLQWGMARASYSSQVSAMMINRLGPLRTASQLGFFLGGKKLKQMSFGDRLSALGRAFIPLLAPVFILLTAAYPFMFTYGGIIVLTPNLPNLNDLLLWTLIMLGTASVHELLWTWSTGLSSPRRKLQVWVFAAPYIGVALLRMMLPSWLGGYTKGSDNDNSIASTTRPSIWRRLGWLIIDPHSGVIFSFLGSVGICVYRAIRNYERGAFDTHEAALSILLTVGWPSMVWVDFLFGSIVPYTSLLFPSRLLTERRESFVIRDHYSSVARPKHSFKTAAPFKVNRIPELITVVLLVGWAAACVCLARFTHVFE